MPEVQASSSGEHPFHARPHRTVLALALPIFVSLVAEPLTGLVDTAFVTRLGSDALAALGVGTMVLSSVFWIFNFLGIGTQTETAHALGAGKRERAAEVAGLAIALAAGIGLALALLGSSLAGPVARAMGAEGEVQRGALTYLRIRVLGAPAMLAMVTAFGSLRGLQLVKLPLWIALASNALNVVLDAALIFGIGPVPALGIAGAAWATVASQYAGAALALYALVKRIGLPERLHASDLSLLFVTGRDLFLRTGLLTLFLVLCTRAATRAGAEAGAAHQAIRQVWLFAALALDAFAGTGQSLAGYFLGAGEREPARRVALVVTSWAFAGGALLAALLLAARGTVEALLVPPNARALFRPAWTIAALFQPLSALSFVTDGLHWAARDYRYLRNAMFAATAAGTFALSRVDPASASALSTIWLVTGGWIAIRAALGVLRIWPGIGEAPLGPRTARVTVRTATDEGAN